MQVRAHVFKCNLHKHIDAHRAAAAAAATAAYIAHFCDSNQCLSCPLATLARSFICVCQLGVRAARVTNAIHIHQENLQLT